jgi:hypothetical protein
MKQVSLSDWELGWIVGRTSGWHRPRQDDAREHRVQSFWAGYRKGKKDTEENKNHAKPRLA